MGGGTSRGLKSASLCLCRGMQPQRVERAGQELFGAREGGLIGVICGQAATLPSQTCVCGFFPVIRPILCVHQPLGSNLPACNPCPPPPMNHHHHRRYEEGGNVSLLPELEGVADRLGLAMRDVHDALVGRRAQELQTRVLERDAAAKQQ